ncbi:hypothetical protein [Pararhizobium sp.]|uniref:hypothetical protein n=1 Tax=Pararhizobium sp. TaxID=1977563 RepID=UPI0027159843|nr:hypothetical protein [Pararhizobium sp.]
MDGDDLEETYLALVETIIRASDQTLNGLSAGVLAALHMDIASDSRTFAKLYGIEHALVLREITVLESRGLIVALRRDGRN